MTEYDVIIAGGGPSGLILACELGRKGISCLLLDMKPSTAFNPQANATQARTMEHYRRLGFAHEIRALGLPSDHPTDIAYFTRLSAYELARLSLPTAEQAVKKIKELKGSWSAAELPHRVSQKFVETVLKKHASSHPLNDIRFSWKVQGFENQADHVIVHAAPCGEGAPQEAQSFKCKYLIGADGPRSSIRHQLGISYTGETGVKRSYMGGEMFAVYLRSSEIYKHIPHPRAWMYVTVNNQRRCFLASVDGHEQFAFHSALHEGESAENWGLDEVKMRLKELMGCDVPFEVLSMQSWIAGHSLVAEHFSKNRVFLMGDAAHLFTPTGGLGYNTAVEDAVNLGWKLSHVIKGLAPPTLLDSYELERRPLALRNTTYARQFADSVGLYPVSDDLELETAEAQEERARASVHFNAHVRLEFNIPGVTFGGRYDQSPIIIKDGSKAPPDEANNYEPSACPGGRPPHVWLENGQSLFDTFGPEWTLLCNQSDEIDFSAWRAGAKSKGIELECLHLPLKEVQDLYVQPLCLIRPDQIVGWRGQNPTQAQIEALFDQLLGA